MAITIEDQPYQYTPIGQRLMLVASSTHSGNAGFRYVFDFGSFQINVQPNAANKGVLDLAPIFCSGHLRVDATFTTRFIQSLQETSKPIIPIFSYQTRSNFFDPNASLLKLNKDKPYARQSKQIGAVS